MTDTEKAVLVSFATTNPAEAIRVMCDANQNAVMDALADMAEEISAFNKAEKKAKKEADKQAKAEATKADRERVKAEKKAQGQKFRNAVKLGSVVKFVSGIVEIEGTVKEIHNGSVCVDISKYNSQIATKNLRFSSILGVA